MEKNPSNSEDYQDKGYESKEIELFDLLKIIWKWKIFIMLGTAVCFTVVSITTLYMPKVYRIESILSPGTINIKPIEQVDDALASPFDLLIRKPFYINSPKNIKELIDSGSFDKDILQTVNQAYPHIKLETYNYKVKLLPINDIISISISSSNIETGKTALRALIDFLKENDLKKVKIFQSEINDIIHSIENKIEGNELLIDSHKFNTSSIERRINELKYEIEQLNFDLANLVKERKKILNESDSKNNILSSLLFSNVINQYQEFIYANEGKLFDLKLAKEEETRQIISLKNTSRKLKSDIESLKLDSKRAQIIQTVQAPHSSSEPIGPSIKRILGVTFGTAFTSMIMLSFLFEYLFTHKNQKSN